MGKPAPVSVFMAMLATISIALVTVTVTTAADSSRNILADVRPPKLPPNPFWGPSEREEEREDVSIRPFQISVPAAVLDDLRTRLSLETSPSGNRLVPPLEGTGFTYGYNSEHLSSVTSYWLQEYLPAWSAREQGLNKYPHFKTRIYGLDIHFQHVKSTSTDTKGYKVTRPLLLLHGWPGSFVEFQKLIRLLTDPPGSDINFELIIPSLPGYGFSEPASVPGLGPAQVAQLFDTLMARLGHDKYYVQGGDWGSQIGSNIAAMFPKRARGLHVNMCVTLAPKAFLRHGVASVFPTLFMSKDEARIGYPLKRILPAIIEETGYFHLQSTKPDTIGVALSNSPSGLAAYVLEKFSLWTNLQWKTRSDGGLDHFQLNELLDNLMVYWVTNTITTSMRFYSEAMSSEQQSLNMDRVPVSVPTACLQPPEEVVYALSRWALISKYLNLRRYNVAARGGHFLAFEEPALLAKDVTAYFRSLENSDTF